MNERWRLRRGRLAPWGWGRCWDEIYRDSVVIAPMPLNWVAGFCYWAYWHVSRGLPPWRAKERIEAQDHEIKDLWRRLRERDFGSGARA